MVPQIWWEREDLAYRNDRLNFGNRDLLKFVQSAGTPVYVYNSERIKDNLTRLAVHLKKAGVKFKIFYALKANRYLPLVTYLKLLGHCGVDVCSPAELLLARQVGFREEEITYTGTSVANEDLDCLQRHPGVQVNTVEDKGNTKFIGVNGGFNIHSAAAYYDVPFIVAPLKRNTSDTRQKITVAGNINEAIDLLAEDILLPPVREGDYLALLNIGGYGSASSSNHCMRGTFSEYLLV